MKDLFGVWWSLKQKFFFEMFLFKYDMLWKNTSTTRKHNSRKKWKLTTHLVIVTVAHFAAGYLRTCTIGYMCHPQYSLFSGWDSQTPLHTSMSVRRTWLGQAHCCHVMWQVIGHSGAHNFLNVALKCYSVITIGISAWNLLWSQLLTKGFNWLNRSNILLQL